MLEILKNAALRVLDFFVLLYLWARTGKKKSRTRSWSLRQLAKIWKRIKGK